MDMNVGPTAFENDSFNLHFNKNGLNTDRNNMILESHYLMKTGSQLKGRHWVPQKKKAVKYY